MQEAPERQTRAPSLTRVLADARAQPPGHTLIIVGGLHANEPAGLEAAQRVHQALDNDRITLRAGRFITLRGNLAALSAPAQEPWLRDRYIDEDLNRAFQGELPPPDNRSTEQRERDELQQTLAQIANESAAATHLLDLHTVSSDSPAFIALEDSLPARKFARNFPLPKILGMEEELSGLMMDHTTNALNCISCIAEAGRHDDPRSADVHEALILLALESLSIIKPGPTTSTSELPREVIQDAAGGRHNHFYDVRQRSPITDTSFRMQPGAHAFMHVEAHNTTVAVENGEPIKTEATGLLFMPNRQPHPRIDDDAFFVIARVGRAWLTLSAFLRKRPWIHHALPILLPGVRARKTDPNALVVAPEIATILRREILHLMGYRLTRWSHVPWIPRRRRILKAAAATTKALRAIMTKAFRGGERAALPTERDSDWIARRHALDITPPPTTAAKSKDNA